MNTIVHFLEYHPLLFISCAWILGGCAMAWLESRAGMNDTLNGDCDRDR